MAEKIYKLTFKNLDNVTNTVKLFQKYPFGASSGNEYIFVTPYTADYQAGDFFKVTKKYGASMSFSLINTTSRENVANLLTGLNWGVWRLDPSVGNNIFICYSPNIQITELEIEPYPYLVSPINDFIVSPNNELIY
jgi:hypothetical protein